MKKDNNNSNLPVQTEQSATTQDRPSRGLKLQSNVKAGLWTNPPGILRNSDTPEVIDGE
jgi:hypothetical protein